ncbi:DUF6133 family protein [[Clostridium] symbiosum]|uniref:DUF6133 family protein n=1 Tax=Clostridium symbiosum TaxID=1512 RepID=UPI001D098A88|nr:DUF6133 family protein [[Clostridium] symbiosum]MBE7728100.1 hypothetical protein [Enterocloster citroniae]MCB6607096.1 DUF6133 family protein [[Clostridium] symbiosum]MCB6929656.1 DUF6133 family protein [[Clostridium] symbiosum]
MKRKINAKMIQIRTKVIRIMADKRGEGFVDTAVKILISVVIGALLLAGLYALFNDSILPELQNRIQQMFSYSG